MKRKPHSIKAIIVMIVLSVNFFGVIAFNLFVYTSSKQVLMTYSQNHNQLSSDLTVKEFKIFDRISSTSDDDILPQEPKNVIDQHLDRNNSRMILFSVFYLVLTSTAMISLLFVWIVRPVLILKNVSENLSERPLQETKLSRGSRELLELADAFNQLIESVKKTEMDLVSSYVELGKERNKQLRQAYSAGMAENAVAVLHNIGNAITPVQVGLKYLGKKEEISTIGHYLDNFLRMLKKFKEDGDLNYFFNDDLKGKQMIPFLEQMVEQISMQVNDDRASIQKMQAQIKHVGEIISIQQKYADFKGEDELFQVESILLDVIQMVQPAVEKRGILLDVDLESEILPIKTDKNKLVQVLLNLFKNSIESIDQEIIRMSEKKFKIRIAAGIAEGNKVRLSIDDNGVGIGKNDLKNVFNFGFTTKDRSSGFGLHDCANFIRANNGTISITSTGPGEGAQVIITLPTGNSDGRSS